jgi:hypothetical protein
MNSRAKLVFSIGWLGLLCLMLPGSLRADTIYMYTGNFYDMLFGGYLTGGPYNVTITFDTTLIGAQLDNLDYQTIQASVTAFSFADGTGLSITNANANGLPTIEISTGPTAAITNWDLEATLANGSYVESLDSDSAHHPSQPDVVDISSNSILNGTGEIQDDSGDWSSQSSIPEPSTAGLLLISTASMGVLRALMKRRAPSSSC